MKIRNIFIGILAAAGLIITGCQEKDPVQGEPNLTLTPSELTFDTKDAGTQTITLTSTRDWKVKGSLPEWVDVSPASGEAKPDGITIEVTVTANDAADRTASVDFTIGTVTKTLSISQKGDGTAAPGGDGTAESPFSVAKAIEFVSAMEADVESTTEYYVSGTICQIKDVSDVQQYGNISYLISDDGNYDKATSFTCHRGLYLNGAKFTSADQIKVGDKVVVCGKVLNYYGNTPEFAQGNKIVTLNGQGGGETPDPGPFTVAPISTILALGEGSAIGDGIGIEGVIISSADLNNLTSQKGAYIQDATGGLKLRFTANHDFKFGDKVKINLSGAKKGAYNKAVQVEVDNSMAVRVSSGETVTPKTVSVADFLANKYEGQYVAVENVQVNIQDLSKTWVVAGAHTSINIDEKNGSKFIVFSSKYSKFGSETVPQGSGTLKGIAARNNDDIQLIFAQNSDYAGLTGARFGNDKLFSVAPAELNVSADAESATFKVNGNVAWTASVTEGDFVKILYGQSGNGEGDVVLELTKNESEESARTAKITVTTTEDVPTKSYVVTLTQAKKAGAGDVKEVTISTTKESAWASDTHATYGEGRKLVSDGFNVAFYKYKSNTANADAQLQNTHIRVYKNNALVINSDDKKVIKSIVVTCAYSDKCFDMTVLSDNNAIAVADTAEKTVTYSGNGIENFEAELTGGQCRISSIKIIYE